MAYASGFTSNYTLHLFGASLTGFIALYALCINLGGERRRNADLHLRAKYA